MEMGSTLEEGPPNPSFAIRDAAVRFPRSASTKEAPPCDPVCLPPRLSATGAASLSLSQPPTPRGFSLPAAKAASGYGDPAAYRCVSSVLKKDGQVLCVAAANGLVYTGSQSSAVRVWKLPEFAECGQLKAKASMVVALQVSNDRVYAAYADCKIRIWRRTWEGVVRHVKVATVPATGSFVLSYIGGKDRTAKHLGPISSLAINASDDILYSGSLDKTVKVWRISDFRCIETIHAHPEPVNALALADDGVLYTASDDATVRVWRRNFFGAGAGSRLHSLIVTLPAKHSPVRTLTLAGDGAVLYGGCTDGYVHYWLRGWFSGQLQYGGALAGHTHAVMCLAAVGDYVVSGSADTTGRVWVREADGYHTCIAVLQGHRGPIRCAVALPDREEGAEEGCTLCTGSLDGVIKVWRVRNTVGCSQARSPSPNAREYFELT
ncbi:Transducin/WD40 repeat-like superfamily protein [Striga hermonthica]|uniref:Transducin/WD40 repeat-like superfamily protein n=1 Tax=Striga hermonthica TaxID=68872 RepID=A0A9N7RGC8_STRHE|nr:Transducin/WD40 repeat-like superfamily protein [Striga hermonthica]